MSLHGKQPTVVAVTSLGVDDPGGLPNARSHDDSIAARRYEADDGFCCIVVPQVITPDLALSVKIRHECAAKAGSIFTDHEVILAGIHVVWGQCDVATSRYDDVGIVEDRQGTWPGDVVGVEVESVGPPEVVGYDSRRVQSIARRIKEELVRILLAPGTVLRLRHSERTDSIGRRFELSLG